MSVTFYRTKHFVLKELVSPKTFRKFGESAWKFLDSRMLWSLDQIWKFLYQKAKELGRVIEGKRNGGFSITINSWAWGGKYTESGLRDPNTKTGASFSSHKRGGAFDIKVALFTAAEVQQILKEAAEKGEECMKYVTRLEWGTSSWTHIDNCNVEKFTIFYP